jgi:hypothetical protein
MARDGMTTTRRGGGGSSSPKEVEISSYNKVESGADKSKVEEAQMKAHPPPSTGGVAATGGGAMVPSQGMDLVLLGGVNSIVPSLALNLRRPGDEMPRRLPKQLNTVLQ